MTQPLAILILLVALLQVWSYPMHDPVMMDRGFLADRRTTWRSFIHAGWISTLCILAFGSLGVIAGAALYFTESSGYSALLGEAHKYTKLLWISLAVLVIGCLMFQIGSLSARRPRPANSRMEVQP